MGAKAEKLRKHIIEIADQLFYKQGYNQSSFSDIAQAAEIPRGNFYYYFKTKEELLLAVLKHRSEMFAGLLQMWEETIPSPMERIHAFLQLIRDSSDDVAKYGCPVGSLNMEMGKTNPDMLKETRLQLDMLKGWMVVQLKALGLTHNVEDVALQFVSRTQGSSVIAHTYNDADFYRSEVDTVKQWLNETIQQPQAA